MLLRFALICVAGLALLAGIEMSRASVGAGALETPEDAQAALRLAERQGHEARSRAELLESRAASSRAAAEQTARESAAMAARVQEAEARIAGHEARLRLIGQQRAGLQAELARRQRPLIELTAALQRLSRRPPVLSLLRPGSVADAVYLRAVLETMLPEVARRTAGLRAALERNRQLQAEAGRAAGLLRTSRAELQRRRQHLTALEARQRIESRMAGASADREADRALGLAEQARDLSALIGQLDQAGRRREALAALPGPVLRPDRPQAAAVPAASAAPPPPANAPGPYLLPVAGRLVGGFGDSSAGRARSRGLAIAARGGAQVVAPGAGRVAFAAPYQSYGGIVILEHGGGWTSLVTGLAVLDARVGQQVLAGSPLGQAGPGRPVLTLELRKDGTAVNPLDYLRR